MSENLILRDKKFIAHFLKVSNRTLDRYIHKYNLAEYLQNNHKKLDLSEIIFKLNTGNPEQIKTSLDKLRQIETEYVKVNSINTLYEEKKTGSDKLRQVETSSDRAHKKRQPKGEKTGSDNLRQVETMTTLSLQELSNLSEYKKESEIYKKLYTEASQELQQKQERLEGATYRVGQLEAQLKNMVPLLEYRQKEEKMIQLKEDYEKNTAQFQKKELQLKKVLRESKILKNIYIALLLITLIFMPIFLIYFLRL